MRKQENKSNRTQVFDNKNKDPVCSSLTFYVQFLLLLRRTRLDRLNESDGILSYQTNACL